MSEQVVTVVEPEVKAEQPVTEQKVEPDQAKPDAEKKDEQTEKPEEPSRIQKRIDRLTREKYELKGRLDALEKMVGQKPIQTQAAQKPSRDQYQSDGDYVEALTEWKVEQRLPQITQQQQQTQQRTSTEQAFTAREQAAKSELKDYDEVIESAADVPIPYEVADAILTSDLGPDIRYYLASHPDETAKLNQMPPSAAVRQIGRIEAKLESDKATKKVKPVSQAPAPITPVNSGGGAVETDIDKLDIKSFMKARNKAEIERLKHKRI